MPETRQIPLSQIIEPPAPMRATMNEEALLSLRDSIRALGLLQPIIVVPVATATDASVAEKRADSECADNGAMPSYEIVAGHRRFLACRMVPLDTVECKVFETGTLAKVAAMIAENVEREDVTAAEEGWFYCQLAEDGTLTEAQLCDMVKQKPEYIYARMDMVRADADISRLVAERKLTFSVAKELLRCKDKAHRDYLATMAVDAGTSTKQARMWVAQWQQQQQPTVAPQPAQDTAAPGGPPQTNIFTCWVCGGDKDPQNLVELKIHWYEKDSLERILREAGLKPGEAAA